MEETKKKWNRIKSETERQREEEEEWKPELEEKKKEEEEENCHQSVIKDPKHSQDEV